MIINDTVAGHKKYVCLMGRVSAVKHFPLRKEALRYLKESLHILTSDPNNNSYYGVSWGGPK